MTAQAEEAFYSSLLLSGSSLVTLLQLLPKRGVLHKLPHLLPHKCKHSISDVRMAFVASSWPRSNYEIVNIGVCHPHLRISFLIPVLGMCRTHGPHLTLPPLQAIICPSCSQLQGNMQSHHSETKDPWKESVSLHF